MQDLQASLLKVCINNFDRDQQQKVVNQNIDTQIQINQHRQDMQTDSQRIIEKILNSQLRDESSIDDIPENITSEDAVEMVIELDSEQSATLKIHSNDDPMILAKSFCFQYNIDPRVINTLANNIKNVQNMQFHHQPNHNKINHSHHNKSINSNHNKSKLSPSVSDKQNISSFINASPSVNDSFNKGYTSSKNRTLDKSSTGKNDTTLISNEFSRQSVFDRLYQGSRKKKTVRNGLQESTLKEKKLTQSILQSSRMSSDPCLLIYERNTKAYQSSMLKRSQLHQKNQDKIVQECTFQPEINDISEIIARKLPQKYPSERKRQKDIKRYQKYLEQKQKKEFAECTFEPSILRKSRSRSKSAERYKVLYEDAKIRQLNRKKSLQQLQLSLKKSTVKINKISECIVGNRTFFQRLQSDEQKRQEKKVKIQYEIKQEKNRNPSTGRGPINRPRNVSIGEHLYNQARNKSIQKQKQVPLSTMNKLTCKKSEEIYENTKKIAFEYIFALLDSNQDGLISNTKIQLSRLSGDVLRLLTPLLIEIEEMKAELDQVEFVEALERLFNSFSVTDKQTILNVFRFKSKPNEETPSFRPQLNEKSMIWARENRPQKMDLYQLWKETEAQKQQRLEQIRAYKVLSELQECTFHPLLFR